MPDEREPLHPPRRKPEQDHDRLQHSRRPEPLNDVRCPHDENGQHDFFPAHAHDARCTRCGRFCLGA